MKGIIRVDDSMLLFNNRFVNPVGLHKQQRYDFDKGKLKLPSYS